MAITERTRHQLFQKLEAVLGPEEATTLMEHLPPVGWADVATTADLDHLHARMRAEMAELRTDVAATIGQGIREQTRTLLLANLGYLTAFGSLLLAAAKR